MSNVKYQPHIDGLRAIAVMSVLIFHINSAWLPGGFIGVDVFFVISGFLITSIINREISNNTFSITNFYNKRVKRILPVYFTVAISSLLVGLILFFPDDLIELAKSAIASSAFISNYYFWSTSGYFSKAAELKPLLHTWSLAVEEQFYIFWPLLLLAFSFIMHKAAKAITVLVIFITALLISVFLSQSHPDFAYYSIFTRTYELLIGAVFSIYRLQLQKIPKFVNYLAILTIFISFIFIDKSMLFPGYIAILPCISTAILLIKGHEAGQLSNLLSSKILVSIGLLSYSLYMWHWPLLAFTKYYFFDFTNLHLFVATVVIFVVAFLSRQYIEKPVLALNWGLKKSLFNLLVVPLVIILSISLTIIMANGVKERYSDKNIALFESSLPNQSPCSRVLPSNKPKQGCVFESKERPNTKVLIWGDSHANHFYEMAKEIITLGPYSVEIIAFPGCPSIAGVYRVNRTYSEHCFNNNSLTWQRIENREFDIVVLASNWANYARGANLGDRSNMTKSIKNSSRALYMNLEKQLLKLENIGQQTLFLDAVPNYKIDPARCHLNKYIFKLSLDCDMSASSLKLSKKEFNSFLEKIKTRTLTVKTKSFDKYFCTSRCSAMKDEKLYYTDNNHLSGFGSKRLAPYIHETIENIESQ